MARQLVRPGDSMPSTLTKPGATTPMPKSDAGSPSALSLGRKPTSASVSDVAQVERTIWSEAVARDVRQVIVHGLVEAVEPLLVDLQMPLPPVRVVALVVGWLKPLDVGAEAD